MTTKRDSTQSTAIVIASDSGDSAQSTAIVIASDTAPVWQGTTACKAILHDVMEKRIVLFGCANNSLGYM